MMDQPDPLEQWRPRPLDKLGIAQTPAEAPASPADPIDQLQDGAGSEEDLEALTISWTEFHHLLTHSDGHDLEVEVKSGATGYRLPRNAGNKWALDTVLKLREASTDAS